MAFVSALVLCVCLGAVLGGVDGAVFNDFGQCSRFFFKGRAVSGINGVALPALAEPVVIDVVTRGSRDPAKDPGCLSAFGASSPAHICQKYGNSYHFATLYDRARRIPLYSAYKMDLTGNTERSGTVNLYEPQLVHPGPGQPADQKLLQDLLKGLGRYSTQYNCPQSVPEYRQSYKVAWSQAMSGDYAGDYDCGHLNPAGHHRAGDGSKATMTYTNVAPQNQNMNTVGWANHEARMKTQLSLVCKEVFVVTGVVPSANNWLKRENRNRVNIPTHYWNAYCCTDKNDRPLKSGGGLCSNTAGQVPVEYDNVGDLETALKGLLGAQQLKIFDNCVTTGDLFRSYFT